MEASRFLKTITQFIKSILNIENKIPFNEKRGLFKRVDSKIFLTCVQEGYEKIFL